MKHSDINTTRQNKLNKTFLFIHVEMEFFTFIALVVRHVGFRNICIVINLTIYIRYHIAASEFDKSFYTIGNNLKKIRTLDFNIF